MAENAKKKKKRFATTTKEQQQELFDDRVKKNTQRATKHSFKTLSDYLQEKNLKELSEITDDELPQILLDFYTDLRKLDRGHYKLQTLKCLRAGLNRYTKETRNLDIIQDVKFSKTNEMFKAVAMQARKKGLGSTKNYPPIEDDDMAKLAQFFDHDVVNNPNPRKIQKCVIFCIIYWFCRRGRENLYDMTQEMFQVGTDPDGTQYVYQAIDEMDKNHGPDNPLPAKAGRMYEQPECNLCPVAIFKLYISKLHKDVPFLWQRPKQGTVFYTDELWYDRVRVGHGPLENYKQQISTEIGLSKRYTNHSIRSTIMGILGDEFEGRIVIGWSGHASENTIKQYVKRLPEKKKKEISASLASNILPKKSRNDEPNAISHVPANNDIVVQPQPIQISPEMQLPAPIQDPQQQPQEPTFDLHFDLEEFDDAPQDDMLIKAIEQYEKENQIVAPQGNATLSLVPQEDAAVVPSPPVFNPVPMNQHLKQNATMNIQNVQNNNPAKFTPAMYFPNSNVTINYHFAK